MRRELSSIPKLTWNGFWRKVAINGPCWLWTGRKDKWGRGRAYANRIAHHLMWECRHERRLPRGLLVEQSCGNPSCVRPDHLRTTAIVAAQRQQLLQRAA